MALIALAALFALGVLCVGLLAALAAVIRFMLTGRKPGVIAVFSRFNQAAQQFRPGGRTTRQTTGADIVDVQAHEVAPTPNASLPPKSAD